MDPISWVAYQYKCIFFNIIAIIHFENMRFDKNVYVALIKAEYSKWNLLKWISNPFLYNNLFEISWQSNCMYYGVPEMKANITDITCWYNTPVESRFSRHS